MQQKTFLPNQKIKIHIPYFESFLIYNGTFLRYGLSDNNNAIVEYYAINYITFETRAVITHVPKKWIHEP